MGPHWTGILIVAVLLLLLFGGRGKISSLMGDFAKGITAFRKGLKDDDSKDAGDGSQDGPRASIGEKADDAAAGDAAKETRREDQRAGS
mgnify:CR=1 FL=1